jgi:hypothetical protein
MLIQFAVNINLRHAESADHFGVGEQMLGDFRGAKFRIPVGEGQWEQQLIRKIFVYNPFSTQKYMKRVSGFIGNSFSRLSTRAQAEIAGLTGLKLGLQQEQRSLPWRGKGLNIDLHRAA